VARRAWVRYSGLRCVIGRDEAEGVRGHIVVFDGLFDARHVTRGAFASGAVRGVVSVLTHRSAQAGWILFGVAAETECVAADGEIGNSAGVDLMAIEAADLAVIHVALHEIISLHAVFVGGEIGVLEEVRNSRLGLFKLPIIGEALSGSEADGPIEVFSLDGVLQWTALAMALDADVVGSHEVELAGINNVCSLGMRDMCAARAMTFFTADIPLCYLLGVDVIVHGMAAVARRAGGTIEV